VIQNDAAAQQYDDRSPVRASQSPRLRAGGVLDADGAPFGSRRSGHAHPSGRSTRPRSLGEATKLVAGRRRLAQDGVDPATTARQRALGKLTARERISLLLDDDSFVELEDFARHRATGFGMEHRRPDTDGVVTR
jgi:methylmalonyl-CoA decarboxylase subunit alpha